MAQGESKLSRAIKDAIRGGGGYCVKIHGGPTMEAGTPDLIACIPVGFTANHGSDVDIVGIFVGIETKMPNPSSTVSSIQEHRHNQIIQAYGHVIVPRSVSDAIRALDALGWHRNPIPGYPTA